MTANDVALLSVYALFGLFPLLISFYSRLAGYWWTRGRVKAEEYLAEKRRTDG